MARMAIEVSLSCRKSREGVELVVAPGRRSRLASNGDAPRAAPSTPSTRARPACGTKTGKRAGPLPQELVARHVPPRGGRGRRRRTRLRRSRRARTRPPPGRKAAVPVHDERRTRRGKAAELRRGPHGNRRFHQELAVIRAWLRRPARDGGGRRGSGDRGASRGTQAQGPESGSPESGSPESKRHGCSTRTTSLLARCSWTTTSPRSRP